MKLLVYILALCILSCFAQNFDENKDANNCNSLCRRRGRCPSVSGIIWTVRRFSSSCRMCINEMCGPLVKTNLTATAGCMFSARITCNCSVTGQVVQYHENCMTCIGECILTNRNRTSGSIISPSSGSQSRRPLQGHSGSRIRGNRFFQSFSGRGIRRNLTLCRCVSHTRCPSRNQVQVSLRNFKRQCRFCVFRRCQRFVGSSNLQYFQCIADAQSECEQCSDVTQDALQEIRNCTQCEQRCRTIEIATIGGRRLTNLCARNCVSHAYCPSASAIIATLSRTSTACQMCISETCGSLTNSTRNEVADCMYQARPNCDDCQFGAAARRQRENCAMCRMQCQEDSGRSATLPTTMRTTTEMTANEGSENNELDFGRRILIPVLPTTTTEMTANEGSGDDES